MNRIARLGFSGALALMSLSAFSQQINPMTEAVLRNYTEILQENPKDYITLYDRASQYYSIGDFVRALSDVDLALEYTPEKEVDYKVAEYSLKSDILTSMDKYADAIQTIRKSLDLKPGSQPELYKLGNLYLMNNQPKDALDTFQQLQRLNPRSQEAFYGMAKANVALGNNAEASELLSQIEGLGMQSFVTYCRMGDLYSDMGDISKAARNYIIAYTMTDNSNRPVESLKILTRKDPRAVISSIDEMLEGDPDNYSLNFVKAILAYERGLYADSEKAAKDIAGRLSEESPAVYRMIAMSQHALDKSSEAKENILKAEGLSPDNAGILLDKAEIMLAQDPASSYAAAKKALNIQPESSEALMMAAKAAILTGEYQEALSYLNNLVLSNPSDGKALLLRGLLNSDYLKDGKAGVADYTRAGNIHQDGSMSSIVTAALGKAKAGKKLDSEGMISDAIAKAANNPESLYLIAVYYAQTGNLEKAKEYADKAVANGYNNVYNLKSNTEPIFNLSPIHHLLGGK